MEGREVRSVVVAKAVVRAVASGLGKKRSEGCGGFGGGVLAVEEDGRMDGHGNCGDWWLTFRVYS